MPAPRVVLAGLVVGGLLALPPSAHASRCNQVTTVTDASGGATTTSDLSDVAARICSVDFTSNGSNGWAAVFDSPDDTLTHAQAVVKSEPGAATAGDGDARYYGEEGRPTNYGLDVEVNNGTVIIQWAGAAP